MSAVQAQDLDKLPGPRANIPNKDRLIFEVTWNTWLNTNDTVIDVLGRSRGFNFYLMQDLPISKNISFGAGIGLGHSSIFNKSWFTKEDSTMNTLITPMADSVASRLTKNKLASTFFDIPLELRFRSSPDSRNNNFKMAIGVKGGFNINNHTKYDGVNLADWPNGIKFKQFDVPNLAKFRYGLTGRIGYGAFNLVGYYGLNTVFEEGTAPEFQEFSIGLSFNAL